MTHTDIKRDVIAKLKNTSRDLWLRFPILKKRSLLGSLIFVISVSTLALVFTGIFTSQLYFLAVFSIFALSLVHELEHDLIHKLYFKNQPVIRHMMLGLVWLVKPSVNPWWRAQAHLYHHRRSGYQDDIEERFIGNGSKWLLTRVLLNVDPAGPLFNLFKMKRLRPDLNVAKFLFINIPALFLSGTFILFIVVSLLGWGEGNPVWYQILLAYVVSVIIPNNIRQFCLAVVSSNIHFTEPKHLTEEVQILYRFPFNFLNVFCFNFGRTHVIHHFYPHQTFYERQLVYSALSDDFKQGRFIINDVKALSQSNLLSENKALGQPERDLKRVVPAA